MQKILFELFFTKTYVSHTKTMSKILLLLYYLPIEFFTIDAKLSILPLNVFTAAEKVTFSEVRPDEYWFKSLMICFLS